MLSNKKNQKENIKPKVEKIKKLKTQKKIILDQNLIIQKIIKNPLKKRFPKNLKQIFKIMEFKKNSFFIEHKKVKNILKLYRKKIFPFFLMLKTANNLSIKTFTLIIYLFFFHFSKKKIDEEKINELLCLAYVSIASKFEEMENIDIEENIIFLLKNKVNKKKISEMKKGVFFYESIILNEIDFFIRSPWITDLIQIYYLVNNFDEKFFKLMEEVFMFKFLKFPERIFFNKNGFFHCAQKIFFQTLELSLR